MMEWNELDEDKQNEIKARQGVRYPNTEDVTYGYRSRNNERSSKRWKNNG